jgi:hypothetical protein
MMTQQGWTLSLFAVFLVAFFLLLAVGTPGCSRPLPALGRDASPAAPDGAAPDGGPSIIEMDAASEHGPSACPAGAPTLDVCGCGCCGPVMGRGCYYPSRGETAASIPNPMPSPEACATAGCSAGKRYLCCGDPGPLSGGTATYCLNDMATAIDRYVFNKREAGICTSFLLEAYTSPNDLPLVTPPSFGVARAQRRPCDGSVAPATAIGGLGDVRLTQAAGTRARFDVHVALFFDGGSGAAIVERFDIDGLEFSATSCQP